MLICSLALPVLGNHFCLQSTSSSCSGPRNFSICRFLLSDRRDSVQRQRLSRVMFHQTLSTLSSQPSVMLGRVVGELESGMSAKNVEANISLYVFWIRFMNITSPALTSQRLLCEKLHRIKIGIAGNVNMTGRIMVSCIVILIVACCLWYKKANVCLPCYGPRALLWKKDVKKHIYMVGGYWIPCENRIRSKGLLCSTRVVRSSFYVLILSPFSTLVKYVSTGRSSIPPFLRDRVNRVGNAK